MLNVFTSAYVSVPVLVYLCTCPGVSLYLSWCISVPVLVYLCTCPGVSLYLSWCISVPVLVYLCTCPGVSLYLSWCISVPVLVYLCNMVTACHSDQNRTVPLSIRCRCVSEVVYTFSSTSRKSWTRLVHSRIFSRAARRLLHYSSM